jgi:hypothetical protein
MQAAQLLFEVESDELRAPTELTITGYGETLPEAIVGGACGWTCSFGPVFRAALSDDAVDGVASFEVGQRGDAYRVYVDAFDYVLHFSPDGGEQPADARARLGAQPWLAFHALGSGKIELAGERAQLLSLFVGDLPDRRIVEIHLDAKPLDFGDLFGDAPYAKTTQMVGLREVAIIVPD